MARSKKLDVKAVLTRAHGIPPGSNAKRYVAVQAELIKLGIVVRDQFPDEASTTDPLLNELGRFADKLVEVVEKRAGVASNSAPLGERYEGKVASRQPLTPPPVARRAETPSRPFGPVPAHEVGALPPTTAGFVAPPPPPAQPEQPDPAAGNGAVSG